MLSSFVFDEGCGLDLLASCTIRTEALRLPGHPELNPEDAGGAQGISTACSFLRTAFPTSDLHRVSFFMLPFVMEF